jgi:hypothetical protein
MSFQCFIGEIFVLAAATPAGAADFVGSILKVSSPSPFVLAFGGKPQILRIICWRRCNVVLLLKSIVSESVMAWEVVDGRLSVWQFGNDYEWTIVWVVGFPCPMGFLVLHCRFGVRVRWTMSMRQQ